MDGIPSCIQGLFGTCRAAALVYEEDPSITIIGVYPYQGDRRLLQIAKAISVETHDALQGGIDTLVIDGVIADDLSFDILGFDWRPALAFGILEYAKRKEISKVVVNSQNSGSHRSVASFKEYAATELLGLNPGKDFSLSMDTLTGNLVFSLLKDRLHFLEDFPYSHILEKPSMPPKSQALLANDSKYHGEGYFDSWHDWKKRIIQNNPSDRTLNPVWNQGRGPMTGLELDVERILPYLGERVFKR
ncbi:hypothetical protein HYU14_07035 [Candidatus Woesearchaeota archaeon]|nr:hypothetical protein [Candidatus Woesearchaeota archaeon]